jgi:hypothetical protein
MPRTCFVIMPFSTTTSCTEEEWTWIFENVFKPAVESAGLDYECRRSVATRGNILASILEELEDAYVVLADLTDHNANVFYELGVRHSLKDRTILVAQRGDDIPFDLQAYAYHVYDYKTPEGQAALAQKLAQLLADIDANPERPDNPVSDFLRRPSESAYAPSPPSVSAKDTAYAQSLAGSAAEGLDAPAFARQLAQGGLHRAVNTVLRLTRSELQPLMKKELDTLNQRKITTSIQPKEIPALAQEYIISVEPLIRKIEQFVLTSIEEGWVAGTRLGLQLAGDWISLTERRSGGHIIRFAQGVPALLAWRLLILMGAKALAEEAFELLHTVLKEPIEVEDYSGRFSNRSFLQRQDLFYPEAFLGYANYPIKYIAELWKDELHLHEFFTSQEDYQFSVAKFLITVALAAPPDKSGHPLYPGYRLMPQAERAMSSLCSRMAASDSYLEGIAQAVGETAASLRGTWSERVKLANSVGLGSQYFPHNGVRFPDPMDSEIPEW